MGHVAAFVVALIAVLFPFGHTWVAHFMPPTLELEMDNHAQVWLTIQDIEAATLQQPQRYSFQIQSHAKHLASVPTGNSSIAVAEIDALQREWKGPIEINAHFLGETTIVVSLHDAITNSSTAPTGQSNDSTLDVKVVRPNRVIDHVFLGSVILLMSLLYINFGAALDLTVLRGLVTRPVGPCIGFVMQCIGMPLLSYALGIFVFPDAPAMQLGLFFTGIAPSGGASNTWSAVLGANINLSVLMTTVSNVAAFATMPMWIFTLGQLIFDRAGMKVPYDKIASSAGGLIVPLLIGLGIQKWSPRLTRILVRLLKPISLCLILFIIVFAIVTNFYLFELFSWQIAVAGLALPGLGYIFAWTAAKLLHQDAADALTIAIETGIQNTGISIFFLRTTLEPPQGDLTTVVPVAVAIMTPLPLLGIYLYKRCTTAKITEEITNPEHQRIV
ncbi:solute carrier family 10 member 6 [Scaptodrosophila lebanonensis]|uniref:Solute carrier family 10 member 6 n=1 Tax=Drosophila lebanonensis TaxID=7225 RepID=A0A6J2TXT0_DROLE|nr:solute carrier family 10 member 6 [Scaptodrosophila lebanonensis]